MNAAENLQIMEDLSRTRMAEEVAKARRAAKNTPLQSGGVLTVQEGRHMVRKIAENEVEKARRVIRAEEERFRKASKRAFFEAAKKARHWYITAKLPPAVVIDSDKGARILRRF